MKKLMTVLSIACAFFVAYAAEMPRSEWHAKVGDCAQNASQLKEVIAQLSPADQTAFLAEVNDAISKLPGASEVRAQKFLAANRAAVAGSTKGNRAAVLAEVFATVPPEYLTLINENFAQDLFNRNANPSHPFTDQEYVDLAKNTMATIVTRCEKAEDAAVRDAFAALMFERASGGSPANLRDVLISTLPASAQETASSEWIPAAMGDGREKTYDPMLGVSGADDEPVHSAALVLNAQDFSAALLVELQSGGAQAPAEASGLTKTAFSSPGVVGTANIDDQIDMGLNRVPRAHAFSKTAVGRNADGSWKSETGGKNFDAGENPYYTGKNRGTRGHGQEGTDQPFIPQPPRPIPPDPVPPHPIEPDPY